MEEADKNYQKGSEYLKTSFFKCRCNPDYNSAIPYLKLAADGFHNSGKFDKEIETRNELIKCFKNEDSPWEEGNEHEKISELQLKHLKSPSDAYGSIVKAYSAYSNDSKYDYAIKTLFKSSENFLDNEYKSEAEKCLSSAFEGIKKYYHNIILEDESPSYVYNTVDRYIDLLYNEKKYKKGIEVSEKFAELIKKENKKEINLIGKYHSFQAIGELSCNNQQGYKKAIEKGMKIESQNGLSHKVNELINSVKKPDKIKSSLLNDINNKVPNSITKMLNKYIKDNKVEEHIRFTNKGEDNNNDKFTDYEEDLK